MAKARMVDITVDGRKVAVEEGRPLIEVCRELGIKVPGFCYWSELEPYGACRLCMGEVKLGGVSKLAALCTTYAQQGLEVLTESEEVRRARRLALELLLSEHVGDCVAPCRRGCPAGVDVQGYVAFIANGWLEEAVALILEELPLPAIVGRVCPAFCEEECRRRLVDEAVAIRDLKRFAADHVLFNGGYGKLVEKSLKLKQLARRFPSDKRVAVIGGGPAGLTAAFYLGLMGYQVTVFDAFNELGGLLRYGIPAYRLPREIVEREISEIVKLSGIRVVAGRALGRDLHLEELRRSYDAVVIAIGAWKTRRLNIPGEELEGVIDALDFLRRASQGEKVEVGRKVVVIGGGNTAIDAARTALRLGAEVIIYYRRTEAEMPAHPREVAEAREEGIRFRFLAAPKRILGDGKVEAVEFIEMKLGEPGPDGRRKPIPIPGSEFTVSADIVLVAIGQMPDVELLESQGLMCERGRLLVDPLTHQTNVPGVFACGDVALGPATVVEAIGDAKATALAVDLYLQGLLDRAEELFKKPYDHVKEVTEEELAEVERIPRRKPRVRSPLERRRDFKEIEEAFTWEDALEEACRCLSCGCMKAESCELRRLATEYGVELRFAGERRRLKVDDRHPLIVRDPNKCVLCGLCVNICGELRGVYALGYAYRGFDTLIEPPFNMPLDEAGCEACGDCIAACPTGALYEKLPLRKQAPWRAERIATICDGCSVGCEILLEVVGGRVLKASAKLDSWNREHLCRKGRFDRDFSLDGRITSPMVRVNGKLQAVGWREALERLRRLAEECSWDVGFLVSPKATMEEAEFIKELGFKVGALVKGGISTATIHDLEAAETILVRAKLDSYPVVKVFINRALLRGARIVEEREQLKGLAVAIVEEEPPLDGIPTVVLHPGANAAGLLSLGYSSGVPRVKLLICYEEDPVAKGLWRGEKLVAVCSAWSETVEKAEIVLPKPSWEESRGTYLSSFGRVGRLNQAAPPICGVSSPEVLQRIAEALKRQ